MYESNPYFYGTGRRKSSVARVRVYAGTGKIIINAEKAVLTGNKLNQKMYYHHSGYIGHLKEVKYSTLMKTKPDFAMTIAVKGMLPDTVIGRKALTRLRVVKGADHPHAAQKPDVWEF